MHFYHFSISEIIRMDGILLQLEYIKRGSYGDVYKCEDFPQMGMCISGKAYKSCVALSRVSSNNSINIYTSVYIGFL